MVRKSRKRKGGGIVHWLAHKVGRTESIKQAKLEKEYQKKHAKLEKEGKTDEEATEILKMEQIKKNGETNEKSFSKLD